MFSLLTPFTFNLTAHSFWEGGREGGRRIWPCLFISKILTNWDMDSEVWWWPPAAASSACKGKTKHDLGDGVAWVSHLCHASRPSWSVLSHLVKVQVRAQGVLARWVGRLRLMLLLVARCQLALFHPALYWGLSWLPWVTWRSLNTMDFQTPHQLIGLETLGLRPARYLGEKKATEVISW